ncbi:transcriptional regulator [Shewanella sp. c952]|uniref:LysR family transcriptional regulator n=1 Tax=Shewanella sp. c952 TaxID=2815913 RepID=UPI001BC5833C|nr:LysR family transcriptional regulator [Shewanella sp. c952]GIU04410.1 transcriptional regulator [Shewanella sp. c952]
MLNLEQLNAFVAAAEKGSFSAAARHIGKSQSSVSIGVNNLELDLGVNLFDRSTKYPTLTQQGERLYQQAKVIIRQANRMENYAQGTIEEVEDELVIAADPLVPMSVFDSALEKMAQAFPFTRIKLVKLFGDELNRALVEKKANLGFNIASDAIPENLDFVTITQVEWVCVCSPDSKFADMEVIDNEILITERQITCTSMLQHKLLKNSTILSQETWEASDQDDMIRLVEQDLGWAFLPKTMLDEKLAIGTISQFTPEFNKTKMYSAIDLIWKSNSPKGPAMSFIVEQMQR